MRCHFTIDSKHMGTSTTIKELIDKNCILFQVLEITKEAIVTVDSNNNIVIFNHGAEIVFGYSAEELINTPLTMILPDFNISMYKELIKHDNGNSNGNCSQPHNSKYIQFKAKRKTGEEFFAEAFITKTIYKGRIFFTLIIRDIIAEYNYYKDKTNQQNYLVEYRREVKQKLIKEIRELSVPHKDNQLAT